MTRSAETGRELMSVGLEARAQKVAHDKAGGARLKLSSPSRLGIKRPEGSAPTVSDGVPASRERGAQ
ncbi:hypothetical protein GCM10022281_14430 [Sphingomonas rosea]|uniref:Uncharacterized protein n=1 Tax=Sphingomonas rosea TaxID=335605 RepID=A0ABP7U3N3_9SPHN